MTLIITKLLKYPFVIWLVRGRGQNPFSTVFIKQQDLKSQAPGTVVGLPPSPQLTSGFVKLPLLEPTLSCKMRKQNNDFQEFGENPRLP